MSERPLSGVRVLDFGQYLAGPLVGMMLADLGAEVIRIDPPGGPRLGGDTTTMLSRGKQTLTLDLHIDDDRATALALVERSDVVIENFRPGVMERLGLGPDALSAANPAIVSLSLPGFASTDAERAHLAAWEATISAATGQFTDMGLNRMLMHINPSFSPLGLASAYGAAFGATAVLLALGAGGGDHIEVPLAAALLEGLAFNTMLVEDYPDRYKSPRELELDRRARAGEDQPLTFDELGAFLDPFFKTFRCADDRGFYVVAGSVASHPARVLRTLGLDDLLAELPDFDPYLDQADWPASWSLRNYPVGPDDRARVIAAMQDAFATEPSQVWEERFGAAKAPATAQRTSAEWLADPHAVASGLRVTVDDPELGPMAQMGNVAWLSGDRAATAKASPTPLNDLDGILAEPPRPAPTAPTTGGWLDGVRILDLTNVIAGPTIGSTLARFGADLTLVQPVEPSVDPWNTVIFGLHAQRGKRSTLVDLSTAEGTAILDQLIAEVDVITYNGTDAQRERLGLTLERLKTLNPDVVLVQLDAWGGPHRGPKSDHLGYDDLAQAATGVMVRFGGGPDTPEEHAHLGTIDALTGICACVALGAARLQHQRTGSTSIARASLAAAGNLIQAQFMYDHANRDPWDEPSGREVLGWDAYLRCYEANDGWILLAAPTERDAIFGRVPDLGPRPEADPTTALAEAIAARPVAHWEQKLSHGSTSAVGLGSLSQTREQALHIDSSGPTDLSEATYRTVRYDQHPMGRWADLVAPNAVRPRGAEITVPFPTPKYGTHTREVLAELGYDAAEIDALVEHRIVGESWGERYLPL